MFFNFLFFWMYVNQQYKIINLYYIILSYYVIMYTEREETRFKYKL